MNKMQMAHEMALELVKIKPSLSAWQIADRCFEYADAMQAEADERNNKERPDVLCEVDWSQAPEDAVAFLKLSEWDVPVWIDEHGIQIEDAPSFGFTGNHTVERPQ